MPVPKSGDKLELRIAIRTMAGVSYSPGDILELVEPTGQKPFGYESQLSNWIVKCKHFTPPDERCVWSTIWHMLDEGYLKIL